MRSHVWSIGVVGALLLAACGASGAPPAATGQPPQFQGCPVFPADNVWNTAITGLPVDSHSAAYVDSIGADAPVHPDFGAGLYQGAPIGIPYVSVMFRQPLVPVSFDYADQSDQQPYPIPPNAPIEGGPNSTGDRHVLVHEQGVCKLYELYAAYPQSDGSWHAGSGAIFNLFSNTLRPDTWTSADAAGLPIFPGLARYDEVAAGAINHALRFTAPDTRTSYVWPARHQAGDSDDPNLPPMGQRFRLKASFDISSFSHDTQVILTALKTYGMFLADNGSSWFISGAPDERWNNDVLVSELGRVHGSDFEAVDESSLQVDINSGQVARDLKRAVPNGARQGQPVAYTIRVLGDGTPVTVSDPLPAGLTLNTSSLATTPASLGPAQYDSGTRRITWSGTLGTNILTISYTATVSTPTTQVLANTATIAHGVEQRQATAIVIANPLQVFLPITQR